jgi:hypothetical protein
MAHAVLVAGVGIAMSGLPKWKLSSGEAAGPA